MIHDNTGPAGEPTIADMMDDFVKYATDLYGIDGQWSVDTAMMVLSAMRLAADDIMAELQIIEVTLLPDMDDTTEFDVGDEA